MDKLLAETLELRDRFDDEPIHSDHVTMLALQIFDGLQSWHKLPPRMRELLRSGALLHDAGWTQSKEGRRHHKISARLIREKKWKTLSPDEVELVALTARYHRRAVPQPHHKAFHALAPGERPVVMILGGIVRIADALDRSHISRIKGVAAQVTEDALIVRVKCDSDWEAERKIFNLKSDMLKLAAQREIVVEEASKTQK